MKRLLNLFIGLFVYLFIGLLTTPPVFAVPSTNKSIFQGSSSYVDTDYPAAIKDSFLNNSVNAAGFGSMMNTTFLSDFVRRIAGCVEAITCMPGDKKTAYGQQMDQASALSGVNQTIAALYTNPPADLALWVNDTGQTLGFIPKSANAQAQGIGFNGLQPILVIWKAFRNMAYGLVAVIMIIVGFMVMFRKKIDPKTVVTVQNALPRIIMTLILITFSYAIVGLMIDIMYVAIVFGVWVITSGFGRGYFSGIAEASTTGGVFWLFFGIFAPIVNLVFPLGIAKDAVTSFQQNGDMGRFFLNVGGDMIKYLGTNPGGAVLGTLLAFIISIAFLFAFIRIFFMLLSSYVQIIMSVIIGPLQILLSALPGGDGFGSWIKNLIIHLIPFPITVFMLLLANMIASQFTGGVNLWMPPGIGLPQGTPTGGAQAGNIAITLIWLGLVMTIPTVVNSIKEAIKTKAFVPSGFGPIAGPLGAGLGQAFQTGYQVMFIKEGLRRTGTSVFDTARSAQEAGPKVVTHQEAK